MQYKEVKTKKGKIIVFCKLDELLIEFYQARSLEEVEPNAKGEEYIIHCPFCKNEGHTKHKLYIKKDCTEGHCFVCGRAFIHVTDDVDTKYRMPEYKKYWELGKEKKFEVVKLTDDQEWNLNKFKYEFDDEDEKGLAYLKSRQPFLPELAKILDFKYMDGNIVMPFKFDNEVFYYQIRFSGNSKIRYFFPPISAKPPYIIERGNDNKKLILCEGVFDAIALLIQAPEFTPFACMGSSISDYQLEFLKKYNPDEILIYMDETSISKKIGDRLKQTILCPVGIVKSDGEDPEEHLNRLLRYGTDPRWITSDKFFKNDKLTFKMNLDKLGKDLW